MIRLALCLFAVTPSSLYGLVLAVQSSCGSDGVRSGMRGYSGLELITWLLLGLQ